MASRRCRKPAYICSTYQRHHFHSVRFATHSGSQAVRQIAAEDIPDAKELLIDRQSKPARVGDITSYSIYLFVACPVHVKHPELSTHSTCSGSCASCAQIEDHEFRNACLTNACSAWMMPPVPQNRTWKPMRGYTMATSAGNSFTLQTLHLRPQARSINCWNDEAVPRSKGQQTSTFDAVQNALESRMLRLWPPQVRAGLGNEVGQDLNKAQPRKMQRRNNMTHNRAIQSKCSSHG